MPIEMERALKKEAKKKGLSEKDTNAYVYGTIRKYANKSAPAKSVKSKY